MADEKLSALTELAATPANNDEVYIRDESESAATESKRITVANLLGSAILKALLTTRGDIIYRNATVPARLAKGTDGYVLTMGANDPAWSAPAAGITFVHKTADETLNNNDTLQNDDDLVFAVGANEIWVYQMFLIVNADPTADFKWGITVPGSSTIDKGGHHGFGGYNVSAAVAAGGEKTGGTGSGQLGTDVVVTLMGIIDTAGTSGNVQLQWAQNTAHGSDIKVKIGSYLMAWKVT